jgi:DNA mismatch repair protein MutS
MRIKEWQDTVVFMHEVTSGNADRSYGIHVARLAGLPEAVLTRAQEILNYLEISDRRPSASRISDELPLFSARPISSSTEKRTEEDPIRKHLKETSPDDLSPREALELLYALHTALSEESKS